MSLICPKCQNLMTQYERSGVVVDQCTECKGIFLDRGELERLSAAERQWHGAGGPGGPGGPAGPGAPAGPPYTGPGPGPGYDQGSHHGYHEGGRRGRRRRRSFLEDLFDFGD